jgi:protein transport protein SEC13
MASAAPSNVVIETQHGEMIHDAQMDYYGKRLATASSDRTIKIFEVTKDAQTELTTLKHHDGPVWQVSWAHPSHGNLLASCSYDGRVCIWREQTPTKWVLVHEYAEHQASVNSVCWAPHSYGLILAAASADGTVSVHTYHVQQKQWEPIRFNAHTGGANAVSWAPDTQHGALLQQASGTVAPKQFVTGGCDNRFVIWSFNEQKNAWDPEQACGLDGKEMTHHDDWIRDVAWAPGVGLPTNTIASCSEDKTVKIWVEKSGVWRLATTLTFDSKVWRVSWSLMGNILAVARGDNQVSLYKETADGKWKQLSDVGAENAKPAPVPDNKS